MALHEERSTLDQKFLGYLMQNRAAPKSVYTQAGFHLLVHAPRISFSCFPGGAKKREEERGKRAGKKREERGEEGEKGGEEEGREGGKRGEEGGGQRAKGGKGGREGRGGRRGRRGGGGGGRRAGRSEVLNTISRKETPSSKQAATGKKVSTYPYQKAF